MSQLEYIQDKDLSGYKKDISIEEFEKLSEFARKGICKIKCIDGSHGIGFFCTIYLDNLNSLRILLTNNHILKADDIIPRKKNKIFIK